MIKLRDEGRPKVRPLAPSCEFKEKFLREIKSVTPVSTRMTTKRNSLIADGESVIKRF
jgi:hypothetical protein